MKPADLEVYDAYPDLIVRLWQAATFIADLPLDAMATVAERVTLTGNHRTTTGTITPVDAELGAWQQQVIDAALAFRTACAAGTPEPAAADA